MIVRLETVKEVCQWLEDVEETMHHHAASMEDVGWDGLSAEMARMANDAGRMADIWRRLLLRQTARPRPADCRYAREKVGT